MLQFGIVRVAIAQPLQKVCQLPKIVHETSGLELSGPNLIWTFNDSGGDPALYLCDTTGNLILTVYLQGAWNRDWEDIAQDDKGNFYIGNIGNNNNEATDLTIFKISDPDLAADTVEATEIIHYNYQDQLAFPPAPDQLQFDCEALFWYQGHLYLCSKNRTQPFDGIVNLYRLPDTAGTYTAMKIGSWNSKGSSMINFWITAADISPDGTKLCLLSSDKLWIFYEFEGDHFFDGKQVQIELNNFSQKEAVCFLNESVLYLTDEELLGGFGRNLYRLNLQNLTTGTYEVRETGPELSIFPNPFRDQITVNGPLRGHLVEIFDEKGTRHFSVHPKDDTIRIPAHHYAPGIYYLKITSEQDDQSMVEKIIKSEK